MSIRSGDIAGVGQMIPPPVRDAGGGCATGELAVFGPCAGIVAAAPPGAGPMPVGGERFPGRRQIVRNSVSSRAARIGQAGADRQADRFAPGAGESDPVPRPAPVRYP